MAVTSAHSVSTNSLPLGWSLSKKTQLRSSSQYDIQFPSLTTIQQLMIATMVHLVLCVLVTSHMKIADHILQVSFSYLSTQLSVTVFTREWGHVALCVKSRDAADTTKRRR